MQRCVLGDLPRTTRAATTVKRLLRIGAALCAAAALAANAQPQPQPQPQPKLGFLELDQGAGVYEAYVEALKAAGYVEGRNIVYERRYAGNQTQLLPALAAGLVQAKVDVLVAFGNVPAFAARQATTTIPIVVHGSSGGVDAGLYASLARPGGNVTGVESLAPELGARRVELLKQIAPGLARLAVVYNPDDPGSRSHLEHVRDAARRLGVAVMPLEVRRPQDAGAAIAALAATPPGGVLMFADAATDRIQRAVYAHALRNKLRTMCEFKYQVQSGCMASYGPLQSELVGRNAATIDKILKGAQPAELPAQPTTRHELVVNREVARELGASIGPALRVRVDAIVEKTVPMVALFMPLLGAPVPWPPWMVQRYLGDLGYVVGRDVFYEERFTDNLERLPELAAELVRLNPDVIVALTNPAAFAVKRATGTIPIVVWAAHAAVETGLVSSLARPGGNLTGIGVHSQEIFAKELQLLKEALPPLVRVAVIDNRVSTVRSRALRRDALQGAARALHLQLLVLLVDVPEELDAASSTSRRGSACRCSAFPTKAACWTTAPT